MADPGFPRPGRIQDSPRRGRRSSRRGLQHTNLPGFFQNNCMKLRKFWSVGGERAPWIRHCRLGHEHLSLGQKPIIWQVFCQKSHNNERIGTKRGRASLTPPPGSTNVLHLKKSARPVLCVVAFIAMTYFNSR